MKKVYVFTKRNGQGYLGKSGDWVEDLAHPKIVAALVAARETQAKADYDGMSDFIKNGS